MPRKKKNSKAAKKRLNKQGYNSDTGQFNDKKDTYIPLSEYSEDSSDEEFINERIQQLGDFTLIRSNDSNNKRKKAYIGNSTATKYRKYGPTGEFTQAAKLSQPITNFFNPLNSNDENKRKQKEKEIEQEFERIRENENENNNENEARDGGENEAEDDGENDEEEDDDGENDDDDDGENDDDDDDDGENDDDDDGENDDDDDGENDNN